MVAKVNVDMNVDITHLESALRHASDGREADFFSFFASLLQDSAPPRA